MRLRKNRKSYVYPLSEGSNSSEGEVCLAVNKDCDAKNDEVDDSSRLIADVPIVEKGDGSDNDDKEESNGGDDKTMNEISADENDDEKISNEDEEDKSDEEKDNSDKEEDKINDGENEDDDEEKNYDDEDNNSSSSEREVEDDVSLATNIDDGKNSKKVSPGQFSRMDLPSLTKLVFESLPFKFDMKSLKEEKRKNKGKDCKESTEALDIIRLNDTESVAANKSSTGLSSELDPGMETDDVYLNIDSKLSKPVRITDRGERSDEQLMKKSVLGPNLEKLESAPKVFESYFQAKKRRKKLREETAGPSWFNMPKTEMTEEVKRDMQLMKMRNIIDPHRHYKKDSSKELPKYSQIGTVVAGSADFYSSRLTKKERKQTIVDQLLTDAAFRRRNKMKYLALQKKRESGGKLHFRKMKNKRKPPSLRT